MPHSKTSKKRTHKRRRRGGGFFDSLPSLPSWLSALLGVTPSSNSMPSPAPAPSPALGGKSRRTRKP